MAKSDSVPLSDAYTGMLVISLGAMILGAMLLYVDYARYPRATPFLPAQVSTHR